MNEEYGVYASPQYLGKRGKTEPCLLALAAILTGAFRPERMTAVIEVRDARHARVLFLAWDWFYPGLTIIADGFGTHDGEGGEGFSAALGLIRYYHIPLQQAWVHASDAFDELATGKLTAAMFGDLQEARDYRWDFYPVAAVRKGRSGERDVLEAMRADGATITTFPLP